MRIHFYVPRCLSVSPSTLPLYSSKLLHSFFFLPSSALLSLCFSLGLIPHSALCHPLTLRILYLSHLAAGYKILPSFSLPPPPLLLSPSFFLTSISLHPSHHCPFRPTFLVLSHYSLPPPGSLSSLFSPFHVTSDAQLLAALRPKGLIDAER